MKWIKTHFIDKVGREKKRKEKQKCLGEEEGRCERGGCENGCESLSHLKPYFSNYPYRY